MSTLRLWPTCYYRCKRTEKFRNQLIQALEEQGNKWPPEDGGVPKVKENYEALRRFANQSLKNRQDRQ